MNKFVLVLGGIISCITAIVLLQLMQEWDREDCYKRLATEYGVKPEYSEIAEKIIEQIRVELKTGSNQEVHTLLEQKASFTVVEKIHGLDGSYGEIVILKMCRFKNNGFSFLFRFTKEGYFLNVREYLED